MPAAYATSARLWTPSFRITLRTWNFAVLSLDEDPPPDLGVGQPARDELGDLALALGEFRLVAAALAGHERPDHLGAAPVEPGLRRATRGG